MRARFLSVHGAAFFLFLFLTGSYSTSESGELSDSEEVPVSPRWAAALLVLVGGPLLVGLDVREVDGSNTASESISLSLEELSVLEGAENKDPRWEAVRLRLQRVER